MLFLATVINYVNRQTLSILSTTIRAELGLTDASYANAVSAFLLAYLVMYTVSGRIIDRIGVRWGIALFIGWWSVAGMLTGFVRGARSLAVVRFLLGAGEPGIFPGGVKACAERFPASERAVPTGIFSSGGAVGALIAAPLVAWIVLVYNWRAAFIIPGLLGLIWLPIWLFVYRNPPGSSQEGKFAPAPRTSWKELLSRRKTWALVLSRLASDPVWYFYLFWLPDYLQRVRHLTLSEIGAYGWIPFLFADLGNITGGYFSDALIRRGWNSQRARFVVLGSVACIAPLGASVGIIQSTQGAVAVTCLIAFLSQAWSTNMATMAADISKPSETATVMGLMGTAGSLGGIIFAQVLGFSIGRLGYSSAFVMAALMHPLAAITLFALLRPELSNSQPKLTPT